MDCGCGTVSSNANDTEVPTACENCIEISLQVLGDGDYATLPRYLLVGMFSRGFQGSMSRKQRRWTFTCTVDL
jgi:hypothetical protein